VLLNHNTGLHHLVMCNQLTQKHQDFIFSMTSKET